jgi:hypothetical protein
MVSGASPKCSPLFRYGSVLVVLLLCLACGAPASAAAAPPNDDFLSAQLLSGALPIGATATNVGATHQQGEPGHAPLISAGHSIWFRWEATSTEAVTIATCGSDMPTILGVYVGSTLSTLAEVADNTWDWPGCEFEEGTQASFTAISGKIYSIQIDGNAYQETSGPPVSGEGVVKLQIHHRQAPANDDFANAKTIQLDSLAESAPNFGATKEAGEPDHQGDQGGASVWFKFTAPRTGGALVQVNGGSAGRESLIAVYTGTAVNGLTPVSAVELWGKSSLAFPSVAGVTYRIAVDGKYNPVSETASMDEPEILLSTYPGNDAFEDPRPLTSGPLGGGSADNGLGNIGATKQIGEPDHAGNRGGSSVWFIWKAPESGSVHLSACEATFHTLLAVYTGSMIGSLTPVVASSNPQSPACSMFAQTPGEVSFNVDAGTVYRIAVDGYEGARGTFNMEMHTSTERLQPGESAREAKSDPPRTKLARRHVNRRRGIAVFHLRASEAGSRFLCQLDARRFVACGPTVVYRNLESGRHTFRSKAVNSSGEPDPTPAVFRFRIGRL